MWVISQNTLTGLGKVAIEYCNKLRLYNTYSTRSMNSSRVNSLRNPGLSYTLYCQLYKIQRRFKEQTDEFDTDASKNTRNSSQEDKNYSYSYTHQRYNRDKYEQRRSNNDSNDTNRKDDSREKYGEISNFSINHYQRLNVEPDANIDSIKSAYYSMSKIYHPDIVGIDDEQASENFRLITESYDTLSNPEARASYDRQLAYEGSQLSTSNPLHSVDPNNNFNPLYRTKDADMIFRSKLEAALQREKLKNPKKFRAGSFANSNFYENTEIDLDLLQRRMSDLNRPRSTNDRSGDGSDFYKMHLYNSLQRKRSDLIYHNTLNRDSNRSSDDSTSILFTVGIFIVLSIVLLNLFVDIDIAGSLDEKLRLALEDSEKKEKEKKD